MVIRRTLVYQGFVFFCRYKVIVPIVEAKKQLHFVTVDLYKSYERLDDLIGVRFRAECVEPCQIVIKAQVFCAFGFKHGFQFLPECRFAGFQLFNPILTAWGRYTVLYGMPYSLKRRIYALNLSLDALAFLRSVIFGSLRDHHFQRRDDAFAHLRLMYRFKDGIGNSILYEVAAERAAAFRATIVVVRLATLSSSRGADEPPAAFVTEHFPAKRVGLFTVNDAVFVAATVEDVRYLVLFLS